MLVMLSDRLHAAGYIVDAVETGHQALVSIRQNTYAAVLLELSLFGLSGLEVLDEMNARGFAGPIVVMSSDSDLLQEARRRGAALGLLKPLDFNYVLKRIAECLDRPDRHRPS